MIPGYEVSVMMDINRSTRIVRIARPLLATRFCCDTKFFSLTAINRSTKFSFNRFGPALRCLKYFVWPVSTKTSTGKLMRSTYVQRRSCNKWCSAHNHILSCARKFLPLDWFGTIGILTTLTKMSNEHELETVYKLWKIIFTRWFGFELEYIEASNDTKIKYRNFHFYNGKSKPWIHKCKNNKTKTKLLMHIVNFTETMVILFNFKIVEYSNLWMIFSWLNKHHFLDGPKLTGAYFEYQV